MLLVIDVGNTNIVLGLFEEQDLRHNWRLETNTRRTADEYGIVMRQMMAAAGVAPELVKAAIVASVVPPLVGTMHEVVTRYFGLEPLVVGPGTRTGMRILADNPREVGADRIVNAVAAFDQLAGPCIVVDFGTATTFDLVSPKGEYLGGAIAPGIGIATEALFIRASKLPRVEIIRPPAAVGKNTVHAMQSGIVFGYVGLVDGMVARIRSEVDYAPRVVATGGLAPLIAHDAKTIDVVDEMLTLKGLRLIHERNR
ncbi:MAG TPA: type III pantothenate kinase [Myxococcota bacterium]|jgi:type III pantothenate kinase|nr:type III pantothenate kinase [Myxococcota bacterium]